MREHTQIAECLNFYIYIFRVDEHLHSAAKYILCLLFFNPHSILLVRNPHFILFVRNLPFILFVRNRILFFLSAIRILFF